MKKTIQEQRKDILKKVSGLSKVKSGINWANNIRSMMLRLANRDKLINADLLWAERAIKRSAELKVKLKDMGQGDIATYNRVMEIYNSIKAKDFAELKKLATERVTRDLLKCETDEQRKIVTLFHEAKTMRELKLKGLIKNVLTAEGLIKKEKQQAIPEQPKKDKKKKVAKVETIINPVESEVPVTVVVGAE